MATVVQRKLATATPSAPAQKSGFSLASLNPFAAISTLINVAVMGAIVVGVIIAWPWISKYIKAMRAWGKETDEETAKDEAFRANKNPDVLKAKLNAIVKSDMMHNAAVSLVHDLGLDKWDSDSWFDKFNPKGWTENDSNVADTVIYWYKDYKLLQRLYYVVSRSRNLSADILEYVDGNDLKRIKNKINLSA